MPHKLSLSINFYEDTRCSICMDSDLTDSQLEIGELALFLSYTLRQMINLAHDASDLARYLRDGGNYSLADQARIPSEYAGIPGQKRFAAEYEFDENESHFRLFPRGFGVLGVRINYYAPMSVLVLLLYLFDRHANDETYQNRLSFLAHLCGDQFFKGIPITQQIRLTQTLLKQACERFPLEAQNKPFDRRSLRSTRPPTPRITLRQ